MKILAFAASLRRDSWNKKLLALAVEQAREAGAEVDHADFAEFDLPLYNADLHMESGLPPGGKAFYDRILAADGLMISSPEYNYSIPGTLKNTIDWVSKARPQPFIGKTGLLLAASPSAVGGIRGLWALRVPLEGCGVLLHPDMFALALADKAFTPEGKLVDEGMGRRLQKAVRAYVEMGERMRGAGGTAGF